MLLAFIPRFLMIGIHGDHEHAMCLEHRTRSPILASVSRRVWGDSH